MLNGVEVYEESGKVVKMVVSEPVTANKTPHRQTYKGWIIEFDGDQVDFDRKARVLTLPAVFNGSVECRKVYKDTVKQRESFTEIAELVRHVIV